MLNESLNSWPLFAPGSRRINFLTASLPHIWTKHEKGKKVTVMNDKELPQRTARRVYVQAFGRYPCSACGKATNGKLCDHITGACGTYFDNCVPLCLRCNERVAQASAETEPPQILVCDQCGAQNWNISSEGKTHDQPTNEIKGHEACAGIWRLPDRAGDRQLKGVVIQFPKRNYEIE